MEIAIPPTSITVVAGDVLLKGTSITTQERIVKKIIKHRYFNKDTLQHDIALLQVIIGVLHFCTDQYSFICNYSKK